MFAYPVQLNALQGFAWVTEYVTLTYVYYFLIQTLARALVTFALLAVVIRGILAIRRGDGMRGQLIA